MVRPGVCVKAVRAPLLAAAARTGRPLAELAEHAGVELGLIGDASARVPHTLVVQVWSALAALTGRPGFGAFAAQLVGAAPFDLVDLALMHARDVRGMGELFARYQVLFHDANANTQEVRGDAVAVRHRLRGDLPTSPDLTEFILSTWLLRLRRLTGQRVVPREVRLRAARPVSDEARALFGAPVTTAADEDALILAGAVYDLPLLDADPALYATLVGQLDHELRAVDVDAAFLAEVRTAVRGELLGGEPTLDRVAHVLATSERTLQRRLRDAGSSFRAVLDDARRDIALAQIRGGRSTVTDVAFLLGFADLSAFSRAFRRWTGASPVRYRAT